ncbi:MAG: hypothetical protein JKY37_05945 [Nannocystaceae bacterium]|nr:hypothetical protein [Nannocystaceae bacterium]
MFAGRAGQLLLVVLVAACARDNPAYVLGATSDGGEQTAVTGGKPTTQGGYERGGRDR